MRSLYTLFILSIFVTFSSQISDGVNFETKASMCDLPKNKMHSATIQIQNFFRLKNSKEISSQFAFKMPCVYFNHGTLKIRMLSQEYLIVVGNQELVFEGDSEEFEDVPANDLVPWWRHNLGYSSDVVVSGRLVPDDEGPAWLEFQTVPREFLAQMEELELAFRPEESTYYVMAEDEDVIPFKHSESPEEFNPTEMFIHGETQMV